MDSICEKDRKDFVPAPENVKEVIIGETPPVFPEKYFYSSYRLEKPSKGHNFSNSIFQHYRERYPKLIQKPETGELYRKNLELLGTNGVIIFDICDKYVDVSGKIKKRDPPQYRKNLEEVRTEIQNLREKIRGEGISFDKIEKIKFAMPKNAYGSQIREQFRQELDSGKVEYYDSWKNFGKHEQKRWKSQK